MNLSQRLVSSDLSASASAQESERALQVWLLEEDREKLRWKGLPVLESSAQQLKSCVPQSGGGARQTNTPSFSQGIAEQ